jgi:hypothetical protein
MRRFAIVTLICFAAQSIAKWDEIVPTMANRTEFMIKIQSLGRWDCLRGDDLCYSNIRQAGSSRILESFQERLGRKRYIVNGTEEVCVVPRYCRLPDFRSSAIPAICEILRILFNAPCAVFGPIFRRHRRCGTQHSETGPSNNK